MTPSSEPRSVTPAEQATLAELGARHALWPEDAAVVTLARGGENTTFAVADCVVRINEDRDAVDREVALLRALAEATTLATPVPLVHDAALGLIAYRTLPGEPLLRRPQRRSTGLVEALTQVLAALRELPVAQQLPRDDNPNDAWHADAVENFRAAQSRFEPRQAAAVASFLSDPPPSDRGLVVPQHNDLGAEHLLADPEGALTGIIDWTDAACADPARDLGLLYRDLGSDVAFAIAAGLGGPLTDDERARIRFHARCKWLEDFRYAVDEPETRAAYLANCLWTFDHTFRDHA
ncbi:aminoglycoside phosphotransferase family protein [Microbacterium sp. CFH 90308]|uniref:Aminoglycoside phosphotransferase family protein n=1 Tax=Microbacterium salsuginis TaxID=2722803 RepID=A0ABX1K6J7_9MICO|nr:aminoglycoside phosphotransferase family protein [Microbacterium sp. CFH 90308]